MGHPLPRHRLGRERRRRGAGFAVVDVEEPPGPGSRIPIFPPERLDERRPDYVLILPWNLREENVAQLAHLREAGTRFIVPIPTATILD